MSEWVAGAALFVGGWMLSVEKRLGAVQALKETVNRIDERVQSLVEHLIDGKSSD